MISLQSLVRLSEWDKQVSKWIIIAKMLSQIFSIVTEKLQNV